MSLTAPADGASVSGDDRRDRDASDNVGVGGVQFKLDGANLGAEDTSAPYSVSWDTTALANGAHTLTAVARDAAGNIARRDGRQRDRRTTPTRPRRPSRSPRRRTARASTGTVNVTATAADNVGVSGVQFKLDGARPRRRGHQRALLASPGTRRPRANGAHTLTAVARDAAGNTKTATTVNVTVDNDRTSPTVSITAPADAATVVRRTVNVTANAADNVGVSGVQFKLDGANLGAEDTSSPYSVAWNTATATERRPHADARSRATPPATRRPPPPVSVTVSQHRPPPGPVAAYGFDEAAGTTATDASGRGNTGTIAGATCARRPASSAARSLQRRQRPGLGARRQLARPHERDDARGVGPADRDRPLPDGAAQGERRQPGLRALRAHRRSAAAACSARRRGLRGRPRADDRARRSTPGATSPPPTTAPTGASTSTGSRSRRAHDRRDPDLDRRAAHRRQHIWAEWFAGQIDEVRVYDRALSATEVAADRDRPVNP